MGRSKTTIAAVYYHWFTVSGKVTAFVGIAGLPVATLGCPKKGRGPFSCSPTREHSRKHLFRLGCLDKCRIRHTWKTSRCTSAQIRKGRVNEQKQKSKGRGDHRNRERELYLEKDNRKLRTVCSKNVKVVRTACMYTAATRQRLHRSAGVGICRKEPTGAPQLENNGRHEEAYHFDPCLPLCKLFVSGDGKYMRSRTCDRVPKARARAASKRVHSDK